jgi:hypothetical protein
LKELLSLDLAQGASGLWNSECRASGLAWVRTSLIGYLLCEINSSHTF